MIIHGNDDVTVHDLEGYPTSDERAEFVILQLEQFIRNGRSIDEGMSFKKWQTMARAEIAIAISEAERALGESETIGRRVIFIAATSMITIGFWGAAVSLDNVSYLAGGIICSFAGLALMNIAGYWKIRKWNRARKAKERRWRLKRINDLNKRIKSLESALKDEEEYLEERIREERLSN